MIMIDTKVIFIGSKHLGKEALSLVYSLAPNNLKGIITFDDTNDTRSVLSDISSFAATHNIPLEIAASRKNCEVIIERMSPDLCLVVGWYWLFSKQILDKIPCGIIGIHGSLLPKYRGGAPIVWAIINGESKTGVSLFTITEGMDEGNIWGQKVVPIEDNDYISDVLQKIELVSLDLLREKYIDIIQGTARPIPQDEDGATYCALRIPDDGRIRWDLSAHAIYNFIRAQSRPYPGSFTFWESKKVTIWQASQENYIFYGVPGQVARIGPEGVYVICGDNRPILLHEIQIDDEKPLNSNEALRSIKIRFT
jgi:methionyl-tRNA formyltransferase